MGRKAPRVVPRGRLDETEEDHSPSALALAAKFPGPPRSSTPDDAAAAASSADAKVEEKIFGPASRVGNRKLTEDIDPWSFNAWDGVDWDEEQEAIALAAIARQNESPVPEDARDRFNSNPEKHWDDFYRFHSNFFKDRAWLRKEFACLSEAVEPLYGPVRVAELGCGPGNTLFPLLAMNENPDLFVYGLDYSKTAINLVKSHPSFDPQKCSASVWDLSSPDGPPPDIEPGSLDMVIMIFVFSALHPTEWAEAVRNLSRMLKPGGKLLFRDYGRHDLTQLRMKGGRLLQENLYIRGDGTRVYFFDRDDLVRIFSDAFELSKLGVDRRLLLNRTRRLKMYRVWYQGVFHKKAEVDGGEAGPQATM